MRSTRVLEEGWYKVGRKRRLVQEKWSERWVCFDPVVLERVWTPAIHYNEHKRRGTDVKMEGADAENRMPPSDRQTTGQW